MAKGVLGDYQYVVERLGSDHHVYKMMGLPNEVPSSYVVADDLNCSCKAGDFGNECKHIKMVERSLRGADIPWRKALFLSRAYARSLSAQYSAEVKVLLDHRTPEATTDISHLLVCGAIATEDRPRLTVWQEYGAESRLLMVVHAFWDPVRYERAVRAALAKLRAEGS